MPILLVAAAKRLTGATILTCLHRENGAAAGEGRSRTLTVEELQQTAMNPAMELQASFIESASGSTCCGAVIDGAVRAYAWGHKGGPTPVMGDLTVTMPDDTVYVYKAFVDPAFRGRRLLTDCLDALEHAPHGGGTPASEMSAFVEGWNRSSRLAFARNGFERCGYVVMIPWLHRAFHVGCVRTDRCRWARDRRAREDGGGTRRPAPGGGTTRR